MMQISIGNNVFKSKLLSLTEAFYEDFELKSVKLVHYFMFGLKSPTYIWIHYKDKNSLICLQLISCYYMWVALDHFTLLCIYILAGGLAD